MDTQPFRGNLASAGTCANGKSVRCFRTESSSRRKKRRLTTAVVTAMVTTVVVLLGTLMARSRNIGTAELEVLNYLHEHHPLSVREVAVHFSREKGHVRTTTLNVMDRLVRKGFLARKKVGGVYRYSPRVAKVVLLRRLIGDFVDKALGGSVSPFVAYLADERELSEAEREQLRRIVDELDKQSREGGR